MNSPKLHLLKLIVYLLGQSPQNLSPAKKQAQRSIFILKNCGHEKRDTLCDITLNQILFLQDHIPPGIK